MSQCLGPTKHTDQSYLSISNSSWPNVSNKTVKRHKTVDNHHFHHIHFLSIIHISSKLRVIISNMIIHKAN